MENSLPVVIIEMTLVMDITNVYLTNMHAHISTSYYYSTETMTGYKYYYYTRMESSYLLTTIYFMYNLQFVLDLSTDNIKQLSQEMFHTISLNDMDSLCFR